MECNKPSHKSAKDMLQSYATVLFQNNNKESQLTPISFQEKLLHSSNDVCVSCWSLLNVFG